MSLTYDRKYEIFQVNLNPLRGCFLIVTLIIFIVRTKFFKNKSETSLNFYRNKLESMRVRLLQEN